MKLSKFWRKKPNYNAHLWIILFNKNRQFDNWLLFKDSYSFIYTSNRFIDTVIIGSELFREGLKSKCLSCVLVNLVQSNRRVQRSVDVYWCSHLNLNFSLFLSFFPLQWMKRHRWVIFILVIASQKRAKREFYKIKENGWSF